jgi:hypothetical protein
MWFSVGARRGAMGATFEALAPMFLSYSLFKVNNSNVFIWSYLLDYVSN